MSNAIENAFIQAQRLNFRYYGIQYLDGSFARKMFKITGPADLENLKNYFYNMPAGEYLLCCRHNSRREIVTYKINTVNVVNVVQPDEPKNQNVSEKVTKTQKDIDPEKFGKLTAQLEYQETRIKELNDEIIRLQGIISEYETELEDLADAAETLQQPAETTPLQILAQSLQPVVPVLAESLVDFIKSKSQNATPAPAPVPPIDYNLVANMVLEKIQQAANAQNMQQ